eukprot:3963020-Amphidinium_carterae.1
MAKFNSSLQHTMFHLQVGTDCGLKWHSAHARCPEGCPRAKTLCMVDDRHKTWHCSVIAELPSYLGPSRSVSPIVESAAGKLFH